MSQRTQNITGILVILFGLGVGYIGAFPLHSLVGFLVGAGVVAVGGIMIAPDLFKTAATNFGEIVGPYVPTYGRRSYDTPPTDKDKG